MLFDAVMKNLVKESLEGQNCLVYTYGVSNSGKTYTVQGKIHIVCFNVNGIIQGQQEVEADTMTMFKR